MLLLSRTSRNELKSEGPYIFSPYTEGFDMFDTETNGMISIYDVHQNKPPLEKRGYTD